MSYRLIAKSQPEGRFYYTADEQGVYMAQRPYGDKDDGPVDELAAFIPRALEAGFTFDEQVFESLAELYSYAENDPIPEDVLARGISPEDYDYFLDIAPLETVLEYFELIDSMIAERDFKGINAFIRQLENNFVLQADAELSARLDETKLRYKRARFPHVDRIEAVERKMDQIRKRENVIYVARTQRQVSNAS